MQTGGSRSGRLLHRLLAGMLLPTDVSATYRLLCRIYQENGTPEKIDALYPVAQSLTSAMQKPIVRMLQEFDQSSD